MEDEGFELHLNNGRVLEHFEVGNMTYQVKGCAEITPDTFLEVSPELASERGIKDGTLVELKSRHGALRVRAIVTDRVQGKQLYMGMNTTEYPVNMLTSSHVDRATHTPAYKETSVKHDYPEPGRFSAASQQFSLWAQDATEWRRSGTKVAAAGLPQTWRASGTT